MRTVPTSRAEREAARRRRARRSIVVSTTSTIVVIGGAAAAIGLSSGWHTVRETFYSWHYLKKNFVPLLQAFWLDARIFLIVEAIVLALGLAIALIRTVRAPVMFPLRLVAAVYVDVMRGIPLLILLYLIGFGVPALRFTFLTTDEVVLSGAALALNYTAYVSEVFRAGIQSIHPTQPMAAYALGLTRRQSLQHVVLPQAVRRVAPPLLNDFIALTKDVSLVSVLGPIEIARLAQINSDLTFNYTPYVAAALIYLCVTIPLIRIVDYQRSRQLRRTGSVAFL